MTAGAGPGRRLDWPGGLIAFCIVAAVLAIQFVRIRGPERSDRFDLPAFDAHAYIAMAEHPRVFTVAPWGYRILTPWLAHALPLRKSIQGFRAMTMGGLALGGLLLYFYLRRLGHGQGLAWLAIAAFGLSGPVAEALDYLFLVEPLAFALQMGFLLALATGQGNGILALLVTLGVLAKEPFLLLVPLVGLRSFPVLGWRRALGRTVLVAVPGVVALLLLRLTWVPHVHAPWPALGLDAVHTAGARALSTFGEWAPSVLLGGLMPLALLGALRTAAGPIRATALYLILFGLLPPFFNPVTFLPPDVPRLLLYSLPGVLPLALLAIERFWKRPLSGAARVRTNRPTVSLVGWAVATVVAIAPALFVDHYRRLDLQGPRDGPLVLALCRETLRTARRLERGETVGFDLVDQRFNWGQSDPGDLSRMRWFLRQGFGPRPHYGTGDIAWEGTRASLLVPTFGGRDLEAVLTFDLSERQSIRAWLSDHDLGSSEIGAGSGRARFLLPAARLVRGDNELILERSGDHENLRLLRFAIHPAGDRTEPQPSRRSEPDE